LIRLMLAMRATTVSHNGIQTEHNFVYFHSLDVFFVTLANKHDKRYKVLNRFDATAKSEMSNVVTLFSKVGNPLAAFHPIQFTSRRPQSVRNMMTKEYASQ
jgi:hypothetical protein